MTKSLNICLHITRRNWLVYKKDFLANISPTIADPAFIILSLGLGLSPFMSNIEGLSYMEFLAPGLAVSTALFTSFFESSYGFYVRMTYENVFKAMLTTPISPREIILGEFIWVALKGALMSLCVSIVLAALGLMKNFWLLPLVGVVGLLVALPCGALGLIATAKVRNINQFQTVYSFVISPLYFLSGLFFPVSQFPPWGQALLLLSPLTPGVKLTRAIFWGSGLGMEEAISVLVLLIHSAILCAIAYRLIHRKLYPV